MPLRRSSDPLKPSIRVAALGELRAYIVQEHELNELARGSSASLYLNFAVFLLATGFSFVIALRTTTFRSDRDYYSFLIVCLTTLIIGAVLLAMRPRDLLSTTRLIDRIKNRMPPSPSIQEDAGRIPPGAGV